MYVSKDITIRLADSVNISLHNDFTSTDPGPWNFVGPGIANIGPTVWTTPHQALSARASFYGSVDGADTDKVFWLDSINITLCHAGSSGTGGYLGPPGTFADPITWIVLYTSYNAGLGDQ